MYRVISVVSSQKTKRSVVRELWRGEDPKGIPEAISLLRNTLKFGIQTDIRIEKENNQTWEDLGLLVEYEWGA